MEHIQKTGTFFSLLSSTREGKALMEDLVRVGGGVRHTRRDEIEFPRDTI